MKNYKSAKVEYAKYGVDTDAAIDILSKIPISLHCWQGDDVMGFEPAADSGKGQIVTTGSYIGRARNPEELMADIEKALSLIPGKKKLNLHASYAIFKDGEYADRDMLEPKHFEPWLKFCKKKRIGIDFNPTFFSHPMVKDNLTLSSPDKKVRDFWIRHGKACIRIAEYFAKNTGVECVLNFWIPDGYKETPADRLSPRLRYQQALDEILTEPYDKSKVYITLEPKLFGIGLESYTVGSPEFCLSYAHSRGLTPLMDNGHYHPTESVADKISALAPFYEKIALHITRGVRWDSDHVIRFDDETKEIAKEIVSCDCLDKVFIAMDYFDSSINRIAAWVLGSRNLQKALLYALLLPHKKLSELQDEANFTKMFVMDEEFKTFPFNDVWDEYCERENVELSMNWLREIDIYESEVLDKRN